MLRDSGNGENLRPLCSAHFFSTCRLNDSGIAGCVYGADRVSSGYGLGSPATFSRRSDST
jgi:hypothetical protein